MSNRKIINAASTGGIGYYPVISSSTTDTYYDNVSLLLNGDVEVDSNFANVSLLLDGNTIADKSNNKAAITNTGSVTVSSTVKKFGTGSLYFSGSSTGAQGTILTVPTSSALDIKTGDFTIELWVYTTSIQNYSRMFMINSTYTTGSVGLNYDTGSGKINFFTYDTGIGLASLTAPPLNMWHHIAVTRSSNTFTLYLNGISQATATNASAMYSTSTPYYTIGNGDASSGGYSPFTGYIDDLRITKGVARYTANFTPPVKALPTHEILDSSVYRLPVTAYGNARIDTITKKYGTGAMYFDGSLSSYIGLPTSSVFDLSGVDFTIEFWMNFVPLAAGKVCRLAILGANGSTSGAIPAISIDFSNTQLTASIPNASVVAVSSNANSISGNSWIHCALSISSTEQCWYINGVKQTPITNMTRPTSGSIPFYIGRDPSLSTNIMNTYNIVAFTGYIDDLRITKGIARYTANFTPPTASLPTIPPTVPADPWWGNVSLLLDGNTTDAYDPYWQNVSLMLTGDDFIDWSNQHNAVTVTNAVIDKTTKKFNSGSMFFDGATDYISAGTNPGIFGTNDFTIEFWIKATGAPQSNQVIISNFVYPSTNGFVILYTDATALKFGSGTSILLTSSAGWSFNEWHHIAVVRSSGTVTMYIDGFNRGSVAFTNNCTDGLQYIGRPSDTSSFSFQGYLADLRITKGIARTIAVPTTALPSYKIQDRTQNNLTVTPYGNVQLSTDVMKNGSGSMFFDGSGDYILFPSNDNFGFGTGDFTVEAWIFPPNYPTYAYICVVTNNPGGFVFYINAGSIKIRTWYTADLLSATAPSLNVWSHVAAVRSGTTLSIFVNGVSVASTTTNSTNFPINALRVGSDGTGGEWNGYIDDLRITKGIARYTQNFTPPSQSFATQYLSTGYDANYADVSLLLNGNGTNGSTTFTDLSSSPKTVTAYGNAQISTAVKKYGTGAMAFDGTSDYLSIPPSLIDFTGDFTIELWYYPISLVTGAVIISGLSETIYIGHGSGTQGTLNAWFNGTQVCGTNSSGISLSAWNHIAFSRSGSTCTLFVNGTNVSSGTKSGPNTVPSTLYIGTWASGVGSYTPQAYMDDFRITKGIARYTTNFTPPTYQLPTDTTGTVIDPLRSSTSLLLRGNGTNGSTSFTDESPNNYAITVDGTAVINTTYKKYGTGSIRINGVGNGLRTTSSIGNFGTDDLTIECWAMFDAITNNGLFHLATTNSISPGVSGLAVGYYSNAWGIYYNGTYSATTISTAPLANTWFHLALVRYKGLVSLFFNGIQQGTSFTDSTTNFTDTFANIGWWYGLSTGGGQMSGYIDDFRITKGYARYTANFTPPTYEDPIVTGTVYDYNYPQVSLLLNGNGTNGSTVFKDLSSSPKTITAYGNAQISTTQKKFGTGSMYFDGTGDYLSIPYSDAFNFGTGDFTIELWYKSSLTSENTHATFVSCYQYFATGTSSTSSTWAVKYSGSSGYIQFSYYNGTWGDQVTTVGVSDQQWHHIAVTRTNGTLLIFKDGVIVKSVTSFNVPLTGAGQACTIGYQAQDTGSFINGYIDDVRITKGVARYTANFTPPTAPLPTSYS